MTDEPRNPTPDDDVAARVQYLEARLSELRAEITDAEQKGIPLPVNLDEALELFRTVAAYVAATGATQLGADYRAAAEAFVRAIGAQAAALKDGNDVAGFKADSISDEAEEQFQRQQAAVGAYLSKLERDGDD